MTDYPNEPVEGEKTDGARRIPGLIRRVLCRDFKMSDDGFAAAWTRRAVEADEAQVVTSEMYGSPGQHAPVLDIDFNVEVVPSSTPGHFHLYLDKQMDWPTYRSLLIALAAAGIIEDGYALASIRRRHTAVRVPWLRKLAGEVEF